MLVRRWQWLGGGLLVLLTGCAKFPSQPGVGVSKDRLVFTLTYAVFAAGDMQAGSSIG